jgi:hypothetical protein
VRFGRPLKLSPFQRREALARLDVGDSVVDVASTIAWIGQRCIGCNQRPASGGHLTPATARSYRPAIAAAPFGPQASSAKSSRAHGGQPVGVVPAGPGERHGLRDEDIGHWVACIALECQCIAHFAKSCAHRLDVYAGST